MKRSHQLIILVPAVVLVSFFAWEWYLSPQAQVERFLHGVSEAAEEKDFERLVGSFSSTYSDFRGLDYAAIADLIERGFERIDRLNVTVEGVRVEFEPEPTTASFELTVVAIRGEERYLLVGQPMKGEKLRVALEKESGDYKISKVERTGSEY
jgi:hypothetical protein